LIVDALNSAKSAITGGVLPGGGISMFHASKLLEDGLPDQLTDPSERIGAQILGQAMRVPLSTLIENKQGYSGAGIVEKIKDADNFFTGYDVKNEVICDMMDSGIYDSYNVIKVILEDAISLAGMIITTECILVKEKSYTPMSLKHYQDK
jgi:chaperonin GroEL